MADDIRIRRATGRADLEAVELTKSFGGIDGHKSVHGVLDNLAATLRETEVAAARR